MEYIYDQNKYSNFRTSSIFRSLMLFYPLTLIALITIYLSMLNNENRFFVITITTIVSFISSSLGVLFSIYKSKKYYETLKITTTENEIIYSSYKHNRIIPVNKITQILEDNKGNIYISAKSQEHLFVSKYLSKFEDFKKSLLLTHCIKEQNTYSKYIRFLPGVFLLGIASMRLFPYYQIYVVCGLGFIFSALYSIASSISEIRKKPFNLIFLAIELYIIYVIGKNLLLIFSRL